MKKVIKRLLYHVAPRWTTSLMSARARAYSHKVVASWGCGAITGKLVERFGDRVQEGPFAGLKLTPMTHAEHLGPFLLGVYESELDEAWATVFHGSYTQIIDIGANFGYYAVGLAKRYLEATVVAFDTDWWARNALREMAAANGVDNVEVVAFCSPNWLASHMQDAALVICDCDGCEAALFDSESIARLRTATLIIETHDCFIPGVTDKLRRMFGETHSVQIYDSHRNRRFPTHPLDFLSEPQRQLAVLEVRPPQTWLLCLPKAGPNQALHLT